jgi:hypothetical protein
LLSLDGLHLLQRRLDAALASSDRARRKRRITGKTGEFFTWFSFRESGAWWVVLQVARRFGEWDCFVKTTEFFNH